MNILSSLKSEIFRPLATIVAPGFIALAPYILVANCFNPQIMKFWETSPSAFTGIIFVFVLSVGLILEDIGSLIESKVWDRIIKLKNEKYDEEWDNYLKLCVKDEIIGQRYLRTILVRLKFELSMGPALLISLAGLLWYNTKKCLLGGSGCFWLTICLGGVGLYLLWESYSGVKLLARTRNLVVEAVHELKVATQ